MKNSKKILLFFCITALLSGCTATQEFVSLPDQIESMIKNTDVYLEECKKEMHADIKKSNLTTYTGGGMLIAFVDMAIETHRKERADDALVDIHKELQSFNFEEKFKNKLANILRDTGWLHVRNINDIKKFEPETMQQIIQKATSDTVLVAQFDYKLNHELNVLIGTLYVSLFAKGNKISNILNIENPIEKPILKFHVSATEALTHSTEDIEENAKMWARHNGSFLRKALDNIIQRVFVNLDKVLKNPTHLPENEG